MEILQYIEAVLPAAVSSLQIYTYKLTIDQFIQAEHMDDEGNGGQDFGAHDDFSNGRSTLMFRKKYTDTEEGPQGSIDDNNSCNKFNENLRSMASQVEFLPQNIDQISYKTQQNI